MQLGMFGSMLVFGGGACLLLGVTHLLASLRLERARDHSWLGALAVLTAVKALVEAALYASSTPDAYGVTMKWQLAVSFVWAGALIGYIQSYVGAFARTRVAAWAAIGVILVVDLALPHGLVFERVDTLREATLPWGEVISIGIGPLAWSRWLLDAAGLVMAAFCVASCVRAFATKSRAEAVLLSVGCGLILLLGLGHGWLVDLGKVELPYLVTPAVFAFLGVFSASLARGVVRSMRLEDRWRSVVRDAGLSVVLVDRERRLELVNPEFSRVTGTDAADLLGRDLLEFVPAGDRERQRGQFDLALLDEVPLALEGALVSRTGNETIVRWSSVSLPENKLFLGIDVTALRHAELDRDSARSEARELRKRIDSEVLYVPELSPADAIDDRIVGQSDAIQYVRHKIQQVSRTQATVLVQGETGVGKELVAAAIHRASGRPGDFVPVNCGAIPPGLFESELFGHEAGAFTDARIDRVGRFELADGGTLFLDEVGELPLELQPKLLRALQTGEFQSVGSSATRASDVRVIAATNRDLAAEVDAGRFRSDLYYRLNVFPLTIPPLRARREDIPPLVEHLVRRLALRHGVDVQEVHGTLLRELTAYDWPGNVRELINVLERGIISSGGGPLRLAERLDVTLADARTDPAGAPLRLDDVIRRHIEAVLETTDGRISGPRGAAALLGLNPSTLRGRMRKLGLGRVRG